MLGQRQPLPPVQAGSRPEAPPSEPVVRTTLPPSAPATPSRPEPAPPDPMLRPAVGSAPNPEDPTKPAALANPPLDGVPTNAAEKLEWLHRTAVNRYSEIDDYICRFRRREFINGKQEPEDLLEFKFRKHPDSIYFKWIGGTLVGRELVYVKGMYDNRLQIRTGRGDPIAGFRTSLDPHSARATANSRRTVDEASIGNLIDGFGKAIEEARKGPSLASSIRYLGQLQRPEAEVPMDCVEQIVPPGAEKHLPKGGTRYWFFSRDDRLREYGLPVLVITYDDAKREVEYYCFDRMNTNVGLKPEEFNPDIIWRRK